MTQGLEFDRVCKVYPRGGPHYASLRSDITRIARRAAGRGADKDAPPVLKDVSFSIAPGESVGLVGPNGAGKTTILKIAARISRQTSGRVTVGGRVGALIEVGSGLHPELTGRENIYFYGRILGMTTKETRSRLDGIVAFSELEHSLDVPVKFFSSGMQLRLGFAIASHVGPDVLLIDEALGVGDASFQRRCVAKIRELVGAGTSLLFVSHDLSIVESTCERALFLAEGIVKDAGDAPSVINAYLSWIAGLAEQPGEPKRSIGTAVPGVLVEAASCLGPDGQPDDGFRPGEAFSVEFVLRFLEPRELPFLEVVITDGRHPGDLATTSLPEGLSRGPVEGRVTLRCSFDGLPLRPRDYQIWYSMRPDRGSGRTADWHLLGPLRVIDERQDEGFVEAPVLIPASWSLRSDGS